MAWATTPVAPSEIMSPSTSDSPLNASEPDPGR